MSRRQPPRKTRHSATSQRLKRRGLERPREKLFATSRLLGTLLVLLFGVLTVFVSFYGQSPASVRLIAGQTAQLRIVAEIPFTFESKILTQQKLEQQKKRVPPIYRLDQQPYEAFAAFLQETVGEMAALEAETAGLSVEERAAVVDTFLTGLEIGAPFPVVAEDLRALLAIEPARREALVRESLGILRLIYREGVYGSGQGEFAGGSGGFSFFNIEREGGQVRRVEVQSEEDALRYLRINLFALDIARDTSLSLFQLLRGGLSPNLVYDAERTEERIAQAVQSVQPVQVQVQAGEILTEPGTRVSPFQVEQLGAYQRALEASEQKTLGFSASFGEQVLLTAALLISALLAVTVGSRRLRGSGPRLLLTALLTLLNLGLVRAVLLFAEEAPLGETAAGLPAILPMLVPVALGPLVVAILIGAGPAMIVALAVSLLSALMQGASFPLFASYLLTALVAVYFCHRIQVRTRLVRAGFFAGLSLAVAAVLFGLPHGLSGTVLLEQAAAALGNGLLTGILVVGLVPLFEKLFGYTTDITLLELTDFNHPLLRKMQMEAPGTYHHSLMVANLAENAAAAIGANALICRSGALFHDIGKLVKPEFFAENQREGMNPHVAHNPSMSALIIKSHVKEGVEMAEHYKLPAVLVDIIRQHHGTTLIQYFYYEALKKQKNDSEQPFFPGAPTVRLDKVNESTYRYEGPKPLFRESGICLLADSIEAASRTLRKATPQAIEDLIDTIVSHKIDDDQLSECPLTFAELDRIKQSFAFTLVSILHNRIEYPKPAETEAAAAGQTPREPAGRTTAPFPVPPDPSREEASSSR